MATGIETEEQAVNRMRNDFEASATHLLPYDSVQKRRVDQAGGKHGSGDISSFGTKKGAGSSRYHTKAKYALLSKHLKSELQDWRAGEGGKDRSATRKDAPPKRAKYDNKKTITAAVEKKVAEMMKAMEQEDKINKEVGKAYIMLLIQKFAIGKPGKAFVGSAVLAAPAPALPTLKSILSRIQATKIGP